MSKVKGRNDEAVVPATGEADWISRWRARGSDAHGAAGSVPAT